MTKLAVKTKTPAGKLVKVKKTIDKKKGKPANLSTVAKKPKPEKTAFIGISGKFSGDKVKPVRAPKSPKPKIVSSYVVIQLNYR